MEFIFYVLFENPKYLKKVKSIIDEANLVRKLSFLFNCHRILIFWISDVTNTWWFWPSMMWGLMHSFNHVEYFFLDYWKFRCLFELIPSLIVFLLLFFISIREIFPIFLHILELFRQLNIVLFKLYCRFKILFIFVVEFVAVEQYLINISFNLTRTLILIVFYLLLNSVQIHRKKDTLIIVRNLKGFDIYWIPKNPRTLMFF